MRDDPDNWRADLLRAGWREVSSHRYESPDGRLFIGPYGAWRQMKREQRAVGHEGSPTEGTTSMAFPGHERDGRCIS
jgi:hypothetical protein